MRVILFSILAFFFIACQSEGEKVSVDINELFRNVERSFNQGDEYSCTDVRNMKHTVVSYNKGWKFSNGIFTNGGFKFYYRYCERTNNND